MIIQTLALLVDAYRELNARKMFWITLIISGLAMGGFAIVGVQDNQLRILNFNLPSPPGLSALMFYKTLFTGVIVGLWLTWAATILALISTASIFPDLVGGGSVELYLSKPIARLRLFLTKYLSGLLFVFLQVLAFTVVGILVLRLRGGFWFPGIFWSIPLVLCFFSYLYSVCVLVGLITRSTIAAILLTMLFWLLCWAVGTTEMVLLAIKAETANQVQINQRQADSLDDMIKKLEDRPNGATNPARSVTDDYIASRDRHKREAENARDTQQSLERWHGIVYGVKTVVPKTAETIGILERHLITDEEVEEAGDVQQDRPRGGRNPERARQRREAQQDVGMEIRQRSPWWIIGTSLGFEAVVVSLAAFIFCRRDY